MADLELKYARRLLALATRGVVASVVGSKPGVVGRLPISGLAASMIPVQVAVDHAADPSFECPKCHWTGVASLKSFVVIDPSRAVQPKLGDGDAMDRRIELPITAFRSTHPSGGASGPVRNRGQTGMLRKRGLTGEAGHERGLAHDLRRGYRAAPGHFRRVAALPRAPCR